MNPEIGLSVLIGGIGAILTAVGVVVGHVLTSRAQNRATTVQAEASKRSSENELIDQLQEELKGYRAGADARATAQDVRMERIETQNAELTEERDTLRDYAHELRSHIFDELPPPPPDWPPGVRR